MDPFNCLIGFTALEIFEIGSSLGIVTLRSCWPFALKVSLTGRSRIIPASFHSSF